jgi:hypothetical protein
MAAFSEPLTPRGVAAFAGASFRRLVVTQFVLAFIAAVAVAHFFHSACFPAVQAAIDNLPLTGQIQSGRLAWTAGPQMLADGRFLAFDVDPDHSAQLRSVTADIQIEFGHDTVRVMSIFGFADFSYPAGETVPFNQPQLDPLWKAWRAEILFLIAAAAIIIFPVIWWILAVIYFLPVWLMGYLANRELNLKGSLKLSGAAILPGALLMTAAIILYTLGVLNLIAFLFVFAAHFVLHWLYLFSAQFFLPRGAVATATPGENPFKTTKK